MPAEANTKSSLLAAKKTLELARTGFDLMDKKRNILVAELLSLLDSASEVQSRIDGAFREAYALLQAAQITLGVCEEVARGMPVDDGVSLRFRSVMGMELPVVSHSGGGERNEYGFESTNSLLDEALFKFNRVKGLVCRLAEIETGVYKLGKGIKAAQKRANALKNIIIPNLEGQIARISDALEDKEREDFVRLKSIKRFKEKKK